MDLTEDNQLPKSQRTSMKYLILLLTCIPTLCFSQEMSKSQRFEYAQFEVNHNENMAYTSSVQFKDNNLSQADFIDLEREILGKKEIFHIEYLNEGKTIKLYYLSTIELEDIKSYILPYSENVDFEEKVIYTF